MQNASEWTGADLLQYGQAMAYKRGFRGESVEDAVQEFALGALVAQRNLDAEKGAGRGYVTQGGLNQMRDFRRKSIRHKRLDTVSGDFVQDDEGLALWDMVADQKAVTPLDAVADRDSLQKARKALQSLNKTQREVLLARAEGETLQSIADRMGASRQYVQKVEKAAREAVLLALA